MAIYSLILIMLPMPVLYSFTCLSSQVLVQLLFAFCSFFNYKKMFLCPYFVTFYPLLYILLAQMKSHLHGTLKCTAPKCSLPSTTSSSMIAKWCYLIQLVLRSGTYLQMDCLLQYLPFLPNPGLPIVITECLVVLNS